MDRTRDLPSVPAAPSRRRVLQVGLATAGALALGACSSDDDSSAGASGSSTTTSGGSGSSTTTSTTDPATAPATTGVLPLFTDTVIQGEQLFTMGAAGYGASEVGEVQSAVHTAGADADIQAAYDAFTDLSDRLADEAATAEAAGHTVTARDRYLRSAEALTGPLYLVLGTSTPDREASVFGTLKDRWHKAGALFDPRIERVEIPYEGSTLPGYWMPAAGGGDVRRPTVIVNNGSDAQSVETWTWGGRAAQERGWNALLIEGPGQGEMLFEREIPFRADWEKVITPTVDWLLTRPDVDHEKIALTGWSEGGILTSRAAAFEPRLRALVTDPGAYDAYLAFPEVLRSVAESGDKEQVNKTWVEDIVPNTPPEDVFNLKKRLEIYSKEALREAREGKVPTNWYDLSRTMKGFRSDDVADKITAPTLVIAYQDEQFFTGQAQHLYDLITADKHMVTLDSSHGAQTHCAPMAPRYRNEVVYDWLDETVR